MTTAGNIPEAFFPHEPQTWKEMDIDPSAAEPILLKLLLMETAMLGRDLAAKLCLPISLCRELLDTLRAQRLVQHKSSTGAGDFLYELTDLGRARAAEARALSTYVGPAPVGAEVWEQSVYDQAPWGAPPGPDELRQALADLLISERLLNRLGPAVAGSHALFLFGSPGNGKTAIAERISRSFGDAIWIPYSVLMGGQLVKLYDPAWHQAVTRGARPAGSDRRWVLIHRPSVVVGAELTLEMLDIQVDARTSIADAPLQLKAGGGALVIDDFGRQRIDAQILLNRWIQPLEKRRDFLRLPDGRKFPVAFGAMLIFASNLELRRSGEETFLRRIPHKLTLPDPTPEEFISLVMSLAERANISTIQASVEEMLKKHFLDANRPLRFSYPRDLLIQVVHRCRWEGRPPAAGPEEWDRAVASFFGML